MPFHLHKVLQWKAGGLQTARSNLVNSFLIKSSLIKPSQVFMWALRQQYKSSLLYFFYTSAKSYLPSALHNHQPEQPASPAFPHALGLAALLTPQPRHTQCHSQAAQPAAKRFNNPIGAAPAVRPRLGPSPGSLAGDTVTGTERSARWTSMGHGQPRPVA